MHTAIRSFLFKVPVLRRYRRTPNRGTVSESLDNTTVTEQTYKMDEHFSFSSPVRLSSIVRIYPPQSSVRSTIKMRIFNIATIVAILTIGVSAQCEIDAADLCTCDYVVDLEGGPHVSLEIFSLP
jgi:hypothetical protein